MQLFGQIDHAKIQAERTNDIDGVFGCERIEDGIDLVIELAIGLGPTLARKRSQSFDVLECLRPRVRTEDVADESAEIRDARAQRRTGIAVRIADRGARGARGQNHRGTVSR